MSKFLNENIFKQGAPVVNRRIITVAVCSTNRIAYDPISHTEQVEAKLDDDGGLILYPPKYSQGVKPGVFSRQSAGSSQK